MIRSIHVFLRRRYLAVTRSIAFYPTLLAVLFLTLAVLMRDLASEDLTSAAEEVVPYLLIRDRDVALGLLTTLIGGIISLMVFSFSMVMVVLSNATANLTPRLLPRLVESRRNQLVLGLYLGTILYAIVVALDLADGGAALALAVALAVVFGIACLVSFIVFIHGVSEKVQVGEVLRSVHEEAVASLEGVLDRKAAAGASSVPPAHEHWERLDAREAGFFQGVDAADLRAFATEHGTHVAVTARRGSFLLPGDELARFAPTGRLVTGIPGLDSLFAFGPTELTHDYYVHGLERITEVALKALSPGINDPGTALVAIDYLKHLFTLALATHGWEVLPASEGDPGPRVWLRLEPWAALLERTWTSLYAYGKDDPAVLARLEDTLAEIARRVPREQPERSSALRRLAAPLGERRRSVSYARGPGDAA